MRIKLPLQLVLTIDGDVMKLFHGEIIYIDWIKIKNVSRDQNYFFIDPCQLFKTVYAFLLSIK